MKIKQKLNSRFNIINLGKLSWFLGIHFECRNCTIKMNHSRCIEKISKFAMADWEPLSTLCEIHIKKTSDGVDFKDNKPYHEIIDSLIYIMVTTRPAIFYTVTRLFQNITKPNSFHLTKAKDVLRYLKDPINQSIIFKISLKPLKLEVCFDANVANLNDRQRMSWYYFRIVNDNPMISWKSKMQNSVVLSTCKAEFIAFSLQVNKHYREIWQN